MASICIFLFWMHQEKNDKKVEKFRMYFAQTKYMRNFYGLNEIIIDKFRLSVI